MDIFIEPKIEEEEDDDFELNKSITFHQQIGENCTVIQICCSLYNTFLISSSGVVFSWGVSSFALGRDLGSYPENSRKPMIIEKLKKFTIIRLACGDHHVLALERDGELFSWGENNVGQLGLGDREPRALPEKIISLNHIIKISAGPDFSFALQKKIDKQKKDNKYVSWAWGNNEYVRLGIKLKDHTDANRFEHWKPEKYRNAAWSKTVDNVEIINNKRGKNIVYKSEFSVEAGLGGVSKYEIKEINVDNEDLRRRLEIQSRKIQELEDSLYNPQIRPPTSAWTIDKSVLGKFEELKIHAEQNIEDKTNRIQENNVEIEKAKKKIMEKERKVLELDKEERTLRGEIENLEDQIKFHNIVLNMKEPKDVETILQDKNILHEKRDTLRKQSSHKKNIQKELNDAQQELKLQLKEVKALTKEKEDNEFKEKLFSSIEKVRREQIIFEFFEKNQKAIEEDLTNFLSIYEATCDTSIEYLSQSLIKNDLGNYLISSNHQLDQLNGECSTMKKNERDFCVFEKLNKIWEILEQNIVLRQSVNDLYYALLAHTAEGLPGSGCLFEERYDGFASSSLIDEKELMKRIMIKANIGMNITENIEEDEDEYSPKESEDSEKESNSLDEDESLVSDQESYSWGAPTT